MVNKVSMFCSGPSVHLQSFADQGLMSLCDAQGRVLAEVQQMSVRSLSLMVTAIRCTQQCPFGKNRKVGLV